MLSATSAMSAELFPPTATMFGSTRRIMASGGAFSKENCFSADTLYSSSWADAETVKVPAEFPLVRVACALP